MRVRFTGEDGLSSSEHWLFPGRLLPRAALGLSAELERAGPEWRLHVRTDRVAQGLHLNDPAWRADAEWFHLAPGETRRLRLLPLRPGEERRPEGDVLALNASSAACY